MGPMVIEVPPAEDGSLAANIDDVWQAALEDAGPEGADKGNGGKYLILAPGYTDKPPEGYIVLPSQTYGGDIGKSVAYVKRLKIYPLAHAANLPVPTFSDVTDTEFASTIPYDLRFFQSLDRIVQSEPWEERDRVMIDQLKSIGIEKGKPFYPDAKTASAIWNRGAHRMINAEVISPIDLKLEICTRAFSGVCSLRTPPGYKL